MYGDFTLLLRDGFLMTTQPEPFQLSEEQITAAAEGVPPKLPLPPPLPALPSVEGTPPLDMSEDEIRSAGQGVEPERIGRIEFKT
jgi:hypothetical protein